VKPTDPAARRLKTAVVLAALCLGVGPVALAQLPPSEERLRILTDPDSVKAKVQKEKTLPPIEFFRSQIAPFDILPYVKANHWSTLSLEVRANYNDYAGNLQTAPVALAGQPQEVVYRRDARLPKTQRVRLSQQVLLPQIPKELSLELVQPDAVRADELWQANLRVLEPHQMLVLFLTKGPNDGYTGWNRFQAVYPHTVERGDTKDMDEKRYYRLVLPLDPERPPLSAHPLTWSTISHVVWDGMAPDVLNPSQQEAMLDWLHWGGQLVLVGGAGPSFSLLKDSFLAPYLPAESTGENAPLSRDDLRPLSQAYPPPYVPAAPGSDESESAAYSIEPAFRPGKYLPPAPVRPAPDRPVYLTGLKAKEGASTVPLGESGRQVLAVERRVGRGRIQMLAVNPTDPALASWPGLDTFVRRVVLRRPEESLEARAAVTGRGSSPPRFGPLPGADLSWVRYLSRDLSTPGAKPDPEPPVNKRRIGPPAVKEKEGDEPDGRKGRRAGHAVAEWSDTSALPRLSREALEAASGIKVPSSTFVLKVVLAYVLCVGPLNWLLCRFVLGRPELAWVAVPVLSLGFAVGVERAAAYDIGYNSACDEVDVVECYGGYPRAHVSRFASLYTTGRTRFTVSYPSDPTALALPLDTGRSLRGEDVNTSVFRSYPSPALDGFLVQPRSLGMFRAEQMVTLDGAVSLATDGDTRRVVNGSGITLRDAVLVDVSGPEGGRETYLGTVAPGAEVEVKGVPRARGDDAPAGGLRPERFLKEFRDDLDDRPENQGEIRLVAWASGPLGGQTVEPTVDRHRGFTAVVVHLRNGPPPAPDGPVYDATRKVDTATPETRAPAPPPARPARSGRRPR